VSGGKEVGMVGDDKDITGEGSKFCSVQPPQANFKCASFSTVSVVPAY